MYNGNSKCFPVFGLKFVFSKLASAEGRMPRDELSCMFHLNHTPSIPNGNASEC